MKILQNVQKITNLYNKPRTNITNNIKLLEENNSKFVKKLPVKADFYKKYNNLNINNVDFESLKQLKITNFQIVDNKGVRGESLSAKRNYRFLSKIKEYGINRVIDLRTADYTPKYKLKCNSNGLDYMHIPIDAKTTPAKDIIKNLPKLFKALDEGKYYIACAQGRHRTDIAFAMNYLFNPKAQKVPKMYGHIKDGKLRYDDICSRANSIMKEITPEDKQKLGWTVEFEKDFEKRKQTLIKFNEQ